MEGPGASLAEGSRPASPSFGPQASPPECNNLGVPPEGCWVFLPTRRAGWHMASSLVPPRDPQAQTPFPSPPRARRMDFLDGARAPPGLRRSLVFRLGETLKCADLSSPPSAEWRSAVWQAPGDSQRRFVMVANAAKGARGHRKKMGLSTRGGCRGLAEAARLPVSSGSSPNIHHSFSWHVSVMGLPWRSRRES